jgi:hypothetical protein
MAEEVVNCQFCDSEETGQGFGTPYGICASCACPKCRGFQFFDDRGFLLTGQPFFSKTPCPECNGSGQKPVIVPTQKTREVSIPFAENGKTFSISNNETRNQLPVKITFTLRPNQSVDLNFRSS